MLFLIALGLYSCSGDKKTNEGNPNANEVYLLDARGFSEQLKNSTDVQLVDVRTPQEFSGGYIKGAANMNFNADDFA